VSPPPLTPFFIRICDEDGRSCDHVCSGFRNMLCCKVCSLNRPQRRVSLISYHTYAKNHLSSFPSTPVHSFLLHLCSLHCRGDRTPAPDKKDLSYPPCIWKGGADFLTKSPDSTVLSRLSYEKYSVFSPVTACDSWIPGVAKAGRGRGALRRPRIPSYLSQPLEATWAQLVEESSYTGDPLSRTNKFLVKLRRTPTMSPVPTWVGPTPPPGASATFTRLLPGGCRNFKSVGSLVQGDRTSVCGPRPLRLLPDYCSNNRELFVSHLPRGALS